MALFRQIHCPPMDLRFHTRNVTYRNVAPSYSLRLFDCPAGGASLSSVANSKQEIGLLTATFLIGLGAVEMFLHLIGA